MAVYELDGVAPQLGAGSWVAESAHVMGNVHLGENASVWFGAVLSGVLWRVTFDGFAWYVHDFSRFSVHGSVAAVVVFLGLLIMIVISRLPK